MEPLTEKNFTIIDSPDMRTLAFLVNEPEEGTDYCTLTKLDFTYPDSLDTRKKTFYIDAKNLVEEKLDIILLSVNKEQAKLNTACLVGNDFYISKKPENIGFKVLFSETNSDYKDIKYTPNFRRPISIIDPEIPDEVKPVLYYDEEANMVKSRVKLQSNKPYIALEIKAEAE